MISKTPWKVIKLRAGWGEAVIVNVDGEPVCGPVMFLEDAEEIVRTVNAAATVKTRVSKPKGR